MGAMFERQMRIDERNGALGYAVAVLNRVENSLGDVGGYVV